MKIKPPDQDSNENNIEWLNQNSKYWEAVAKEYQHLYQTRWSLAENDDVRDQLYWIDKTDCETVLELGSGTGLGYQITKSINNRIQYFGIDISKSMSEYCTQQYSDGTFIEGSMTNLSMFPDESFCSVISLFTSFSFSENPAKTIEEVYRVLKPGGVIFVSVLNRWSLRRMLRLKFGRIERYKTRGSNYIDSTFANVFTIQEIISLLYKYEFTNVSINGQSTLGGVMEYYPLWKLDSLVSKRFPWFCHMLNAKAKKGET